MISEEFEKDLWWLQDNRDKAGLKIFLGLVNLVTSLSTLSKQAQAELIGDCARDIAVKVESGELPRN